MTMSNSCKEQIGKDERVSKAEDREDNQLVKSFTDSGYAWVISLTSFVTFVIFGGFMRVDGIFFITFQSKFHTSATFTSWLGAILATTHNFTSPLVTAFTNRYSVRTAVILAGFLGSSGFILTAFAPNAYCLFFTYSILQGLARSLTTVPAQLITSRYFLEKRGQALAIATCGSGVGGILLFPLIQWLLDLYGYQGMFLILAAVALNSLVCAFLFRPFSHHVRYLRQDYRKSPQHQTDQDNSTKASEEKPVGSNKNNDERSYLRPSSMMKESDIEGKKPAERSLSQRPYYQSTKNTTGYQSIDSKNTTESITDSHNMTKNIKDKDNMEDAPKSSINSKEESEKHSYMSLKSLIDRESPRSIQKWACKVKDSIREKIKRVFKSIYEGFSVCFPVDSYNKEDQDDKKSQIFHWSIFTDPSFIMICICVLFYQLSAKNTYDFYPVIAYEKGFTDAQVAIVQGCMQASDLLGKLACGYLLDLKQLVRFQRSSFVAMQLLAGVALLFVPAADSAVIMGTLGVVFGFFVGAVFNLRLLVLASLMGEDVLSSSFGVMLAFQGFATFTGTPISGALKDAYGTFDYTFYLSGSSLFLAAFFGFMAIIIVLKRDK